MAGNICVSENLSTLRKVELGLENNFEEAFLVQVANFKFRYLIKNKDLLHYFA